MSYNKENMVGQISSKHLCIHFTDFVIMVDDLCHDLLILMVNNTILETKIILMMERILHIS